MVFDENVTLVHTQVALTNTNRHLVQATSVVGKYYVTKCCVLTICKRIPSADTQIQQHNLVRTCIHIHCNIQYNAMSVIYRIIHVIDI